MVALVSEGPTSPKWTGRITLAVLTILAVAVGARVAYAVLAPTIPMLVALAVLLAVWRLLLGRWRR